jgi:hypothetical protein
MTTQVRIDHVIIGARDIEQVRPLLWESYGFGVIQGSAHEDGTQGWLVPFDSPQVQYLELLTPREGQTMSHTPFGRAFLERTAAGPAFLSWAVLSENIDDDAARVSRLTGADPGLLRGGSVRADGQRYPWAEAAFAAAWNCPSRPFFLEYGNWPARVGRVPGDVARAGHRRTPVELAGIRLRTAQKDLTSWWGGVELPTVIEPGDQERVEAVRVRTIDGEVEVVLT